MIDTQFFNPLLCTYPPGFYVGNFLLVECFLGVALSFPVSSMFT